MLLNKLNKVIETLLIDGDWTNMSDVVMGFEAEECRYLQESNQAQAVGHSEHDLATNAENERGRRLRASGHQIHSLGRYG